MGLRKKKTTAKTEPAATGSTWTKGSALGAKATSTLLIAAALCGPVGLVVGFTAMQQKPAAAQVAVDDRLTPQQQSAGEYAAGFVGAWLSATQDAPGNLSDYVDDSSIRQLSSQAWAYRDLTVVSVNPEKGTDLVSAVVAANVEEYDMSSDKGTKIWPRRYFNVAVRVVDGKGLSVVGLPSPIAAPTRVEAPVQLAYEQTVLANSAARSTVEAFLGAYLAGSGDITRYVTPGVSIRAIHPAPYQSLTVTDVSSDVEATDSPRDGSKLHVLAVVEVQAATDQQLTTTYALTLTARGGRWETTSVDLAPLESVDTGAAPATTPSQ